MSVSPSQDRRCLSCGVIGAPHGSDADCVAALKAKVDQLNAFVESLVKQSVRRSAAAHPDVPSSRRQAL